MHPKKAQAQKLEPWGAPQNERCRVQFQKFNDTDGEDGWDPETLGPKYILNVGTSDDLLRPYACCNLGGYEKHTNNTKLLDGYKRCAAIFCRDIPEEFYTIKSYKQEMERFDEKFQYEYGTGGKMVKLGGGTFGNVYLASWKTGDKGRVAIKTPNSIAIDLKRAKQVVEDAAMEVRVWQRISLSCFILPLLDNFVISKYTNAETGQPIPWLITVAPYREDTLTSYIMEDKREAMESHEIFLFAYQLMLGVSHMHSNDIVHMDINPDNILIEYNKKY